MGVQWCGGGGVRNKRDFMSRNGTAFTFVNTKAGLQHLARYTTGFTA